MLAQTADGMFMQLSRSSAALLIGGFFSYPLTLAPQTTPIAPVVFWPSENQSEGLLSKWICEISNLKGYINKVQW